MFFKYSPWVFPSDKKSEADSLILLLIKTSLMVLKSISQ